MRHLAITGMVTASMILQDQLGVAHARHAAVGADIGRDAFQRHHGAGAGIFGDPGMFGGDHIHDHATFEHLGQTLLHRKEPSCSFHCPTSLA